MDKYFEKKMDKKKTYAPLLPQEFDTIYLSYHRDKIDYYMKRNNF